jgi:alcohol dehydrogenase (cytochrome c)
MAVIASTLLAQQPERKADDQQWPLIGGDLTNQRYSRLALINKENVHTLGGAWMSSQFDGDAQSRATPVVVNGIMYITAGPWIYALDAKLGQTVWKTRADERPLPPGTNLMNPVAQAEALKTDRKLPSASGVAFGQNLVFAGLTGGEVSAFDSATGAPVWTTQIGDDPPPKGQSVSGVPLYYNGKIFVGLANGDFGLRGRVAALDAKTGKKLWQFFTVPGPGEFGHETWQADNDAWKFGGGGVWLVGCLDPELGLVYFSTGNPVPMTGGEIRGGNNLFTDSVVALEMQTGKLRWHYQLVHHDIWDADVAVAPLLYEAHSATEPVKALAAVRSDGYMFMFDRKTGKPMLPVQERPVPQDRFAKTSATQPYPVGGNTVLGSCEDWMTKFKAPPGFTIGCAFAPVSFNSNVVAPNFGVRVAPMSYSPETGYLYASAGATLGSRRRISSDPYFVSVGGPSIPGRAAYATFTAIDSRTGKAVWSREVPPASVGRRVFFRPPAVYCFGPPATGMLPLTTRLLGTRCGNSTSACRAEVVQSPPMH